MAGCTVAVMHIPQGYSLLLITRLSLVIQLVQEWVTLFWVEYRRFVEFTWPFFPSFCTAFWALRITYHLVTRFNVEFQVVQLFLHRHFRRHNTDDGSDSRSLRWPRR